MTEFDFISPRQKNIIPVNDHERFLKIKAFEETLRICWAADTCADYEKDLWRANLPAFGQCAVTTILAQEIFGGKIVKDPDNDHYFNILDDGKTLDLTREQMPVSANIEAKLERTREYMLDSERAKGAKTKERYELLKKRVIGVLASNF